MMLQDLTLGLKDPRHVGRWAVEMTRVTDLTLSDGTNVQFRLNAPIARELIGMVGGA